MHRLRDRAKENPKRTPVRLEERIRVPHPASDVFAALEDLDRYKEWIPYLVSARWLDPPPLRVGSRVEFQFQQLTLHSRIEERVPNRRCLVVGEEVDRPTILSWQEDFDLEESASGETLVVHGVHYEPGTLLWLLGPLGRWAIRRTLAKTLSGLARFLDRRGKAVRP